MFWFYFSHYFVAFVPLVLAFSAGFLAAKGEWVFMAACWLNALILTTMVVNKALRALNELYRRYKD